MEPNSKKICTAFGPEFGDNAGKSAIIVRVFYDLKGVCASFIAHLSQFMWELGYESCDADCDLWMKAEYNMEDKLEYYS